MIEMNADDLRSKDGSGFFRDASLSLSLAILILLGTLITILGLLLFPVSLGIIPFSPDGQLGLLMVIMAIQMLARGETPMGQYKRSWFLIIIGIVFAAMGIFSCIVPGILTDVIRILIGFLNITGGLILLIGLYLPIHDTGTPVTESVEVPPIFKKLRITQTILNGVTIVFGISMLIPGIAPGLVIAGILVINGLLLFVLAGILRKIS